MTPSDAKLIHDAFTEESKTKRRYEKNGGCPDGTKSAEYSIWCAMRYRCSKENRPEFKNYGGRGITVCRRWDESYLAFITDIGHRPSPLHTLERKDNSKGYDPDNCIWDTRKSQANNRRCCDFITHNGETKTLTQWAEYTGIKPKTMWTRIYRNGWSAEDAITTPIDTKMRNGNAIV